MKKYGISLFTIIGISLYIIIYLVDRFAYEMSDLLYTGGLVVCLALMITGIVVRRKK